MIQISFIIPVYNCKPYLKNCVDSIRAAGAQNFEILLIDDGSSDGSGELCDFLEKQYREVRTVHQSNAGVSAARNRGIQEAVGEYILFVDSDDTLQPFEESLFRNMNDGVDVLIFGMKFRYYHKDSYMKEEVLVVNEEKRYSLKAVAKTFEPLFFKNYFSSSCNKFVKRSILIENRLAFNPRLTNYEDLAFSLQVLSKCNTIAVLPQPYYIYRVDYDHDKTINRIAKIRDIMGNTDLIADTFAEFEKAAVKDGARDTHQVWRCLLNIYFELFHVKMKTTEFAQIRRYCADFKNDAYVDMCLKTVGFSGKSQARWYDWICSENVCAIWLYTRYVMLRHFLPET